MKILKLICILIIVWTYTSKRNRSQRFPERDNFLAQVTTYEGEGKGIDDAKKRLLFGQGCRPQDICAGKMTCDFNSLYHTCKGSVDKRGDCFKNGVDSCETIGYCDTHCYNCKRYQSLPNPKTLIINQVILLRKNDKRPKDRNLYKICSKTDECMKGLECLNEQCLVKAEGWCTQDDQCQNKCIDKKCT